MNELFIVRDYENDRVLDVYLTDDAIKCKDIFANLDAQYCENDSDDNLHPLNSGIFEKTCEKNGVSVFKVNNTTTGYF